MEHHSKPSTRMKRKPSTTTVFPNSKRRRHHPLPAPVSLGLASSVSTRSKFKPQHSNLHRASKLKPEKEEQLTLFSRYADPSVNSPKPYKYKSTKVNQVDRRQPNEAVAVKEVVDLASVSDMTNLDMVEGDEILATMLRASTPRSKRRFPTEKTLTDSEQRDQEAIRRRRLKIRSEYSAMKDQQKLRDENIGFTALLHDIEAERNLKEHSAIKKGAGEVRVDERAQLELEQAETDEETTESKINRLSKALHMNWRHFMQWLLSGVVLLCVVVMAAPFVRKILETPLPYCDSEWIEAIDESFVLTDPADDFDRSKALQPFIGANTNTNLASRPACQPCPVFGNCLNGSVISCAPPFTLRAELCTEDQEAQENLNRVARNIYKFVAEKAAKNVCENVSIWSNFGSGGWIKSRLKQEHSALINVLLSDVQAFVTETISFGKAVSILPREYVFNRALDMALRNLGDTCVTEDQSQLIVSENVVPWSCRAKRQLYSHIKLIMLAITLGTMLVFSYRKFLFYRAERQLVDRFVKEVRFCLLDRTRRPDRYYPSDHLRDDLFEKQSVQDRAWLIKSVWPKVVAIVNDDSRIKTRLMKVRGDDQIVWEWAFSSSPARQPTRGEAYRVSLRPQSASRNRFRSTQVNQRKKAAIVTIDGFLVYKKNTNAIKSKKIDLIKTTFTGSIVQGSGYFYFELQCGSAQMAIGFPAIEDARLWLSGMMEAADENSAGRRLWMANLRHMLTLRLQDRWELVSVMTNRDWYSEWNFCLRALRDEEEPILSRQRRLRRLHTIWLQFELFSEILAEMFLSSVQQRDAHGHKPDISQQKETSKDNDCGRGSKYFKRNDVDEMKFAGIHLQFASKSWQGHKRLAKEMTLFSKFRSLIEVFLSEKQPSLLQAALVRLPTFPLISAFSIQDVNVVAIAEPLQIDQSILMTIDKRDLTDLSVALREAKLLQFFPYQELPKLVVRQFLSQTSTSTLVTIHSRFDDVLVNSLRSSMVHGVLVRAADSVSESSSQIELMSAHDLKELIATKKPTWIPYLDLVYYQLNSESCPVKNFASEKFLLQSGSHRSHPLTGDIVFTFDTKNSKLPLDLPEAFVRNHEMDLCSLVQKLQEVKKNTALFNFTSSNSTLSRSQIGQLRPLDSSMQVAREFEDAVKKLFVQHIKDFAAQLLTLGDFCRCEVDGQFEDPTKKTSQGMRLMRSNTMSSMPRPRDVFASSAALKSNEFESESGSIAQPRLQQRTSSLSSIPLTHEATKSTDHTLGTYVIDTIHLRQTMRESGVNVRFLPLVFHYLGSHKQQGVQVLVASEIVARLAKNWFRYQMLNEDTGKKNCWKSRKWRLIRLINSIMHGLFHKNLPCVVSECSGDQFWNIDGPILYLLGAFSSSFAMDPHVLSNVANPGVIFDKYRDLLRMSPSILFNNLLFVFQAQLIPSILTKLHENRFMSLPFLQTEADLSFEYEDQDPKFAIHIHENLLWSHLHFFQVLYETLKPALPNPEKQINKIGSMQWTQYYRTLSSIFRQSIGHSHLTRLENAIQSWQDLTSVRVLLTFALRAADIYIRHLSDNQDTLSSIRKHCHNAHERMASSKALFPIEYKLVLLCLELMCTGIEPVNALNDSNELQEWLKIFYRPANSSQFLKNSSSHPLFSVLYTASMKRSEQSSAELSLRDKFQDQQYQQLWTSSMTVANAYCRRIKHIRQNPITLAATTAVLREFKNTDPYDSIKLNVSRTGKNQISGLTSQSSTTPSINSFRGDVLQFIECFLLPPFATHSLRVAGCALANNNDIVSLLPSTLHQTISKSPVPGFALMWGNPLGLSLDDEAQISREPHMKSSLRPRPETAASICTLSFPPSIRCVVQIACGYRHTALITDDRLLYTFGHGECGRLGHGTEESCHDPKPVSYFLNLIAAKGVAAGIVDVSCGREHTMVVTANGHLFGFGWGEAGRLGTGETGSTLHPSRVELTNITKVACGREHTLALNRKGQVFAFGAGFQGRLGTGYETDEKFPAIVEGLDGYIITAMDAGECHSCALSTNGTIFTWGFGHSGALGHNSRDNCLKPTLVTGPWSNNEQVSEDDTPSKEVLVTFISCGGYHTLATTSNGVLYGWGDAAAGQLGPECLNAPDFVILSPTIIRTPTFSKINNISCGMFTSAMCNTQGQLFMWGSPAAGNGASLPEDDAEIKKIDFLDEFDFAQIACGAYHAVAITRKLEYC